ncbi:MAG: hypothetical protein C4335_03460 [Armatimonadota bacterium]
MTPKHAHLLIDFYGKLCANSAQAARLLKAIVEVWHGAPVQQVINQYASTLGGLPGYPADYILHALNWILEQGDINFVGRPAKKQKELNDTCRTQGVAVPGGRLSSQLAISLFCDVANGTHPVEALLKVNLDVTPRRRM